MKLGQIYKLGIDMGIDSDLRGAAAVKEHLKKHKREFDAMSVKDKKFADAEILHNPYPDSRIEFGDQDKEVKTILAGIDMSTSEVLLADRLGNIDLVLAHHPEGRSLIELDEVMHLQAEVLAKYGVPINIAQGILRDRISEVARKIHPDNQYQAIDTARLLKMPFMCAHTICDNLAATFVKNALDKAKPKTVGEILEILYTIPEYAEAIKLGSGPVLFAGSPKNYAGRVAVTEFTGGTEGSELIFERMSHAGIGTIIAMHLNEKSRKEAEKHHINVVVAGHMSSDSLGMNLFLDQLEKRGVKVIPTSGLIRVSRNKKK